jgi:hypothetical protein
MSRLGYNHMQIEKGSSSKTIEHEAEQSNYAEIVKGTIKKEEYKKTQEENHRGIGPPRIFITQNQKSKAYQEEEGFRRETPFRRSPTSMYQTIFLGLSYSCNNFGHKVAKYRAYAKNRSNYEVYSNKKYPRKKHETHNINHNSFGSLSNEVEFYKCNNFGHMDKYCRLIVLPREPNHNIKQEPERIWKRKQDQFNT